MASIRYTVCQVDTSDKVDCDIFVDSPEAEVAATATYKNKGVDALHLMEKQKIKNSEATGVLNNTTQLVHHGELNTLSRQFSANDRMLQYRCFYEDAYSDTIFVTGKAKSSRGNACGQIFVTDCCYLSFYGMKSKSQFLDSLKLQAKEVGISEHLIVDAIREQTFQKVKHFCQQISTNFITLQESTQLAFLRKL